MIAQHLDVVFRVKPPVLLIAQERHADRDAQADADKVCGLDLDHIGDAVANRAQKARHQRIIIVLGVPVESFWSGTRFSSYSSTGDARSFDHTLSGGALVASTAVLCGTTIEIAHGVVISRGLPLRLARSDPQVPVVLVDATGDVNLFARIDQMDCLPRTRRTLRW